MKYRFIQRVIENLETFETDTGYLGKLKGCNNADIQKLNNFYNDQLPQCIFEIMEIGGHNFFSFYYQIEFCTGYNLWHLFYEHTQDSRFTYNSIPLNLLELPQKNRFYIALAECFILYCPLSEDNDPCVYEAQYDIETDILTTKLKFSKLTDLINLIVDEQAIEYKAFVERKKQGVDMFTIQLIEQKKRRLKT